MRELIDMRGLTKILIVLGFIVLSSGLNELKASHMAGGQICYENVGTDSFLVNVQVFRACRGAGYQATSINVTASSTCGGSTTVTLQRVNVSQVQGGQDISQVCTTGNSNCQNSNATQGYLKYEYEGIFVLRPRCNTWRISHTPPCCRNSTVNTNGGSVYYESILYTQTDSANNSPCFRTSAIPYVCAGFAVSYNMGATDPDGDSLTYQFSSARSAQNTNITYRTGYSAQAPIPGITLDSLTGQINFTPNITGAFIVVVQIREYDSNGNLKGITMRDIQFRVETCANTPPYDTLGIQNYTGVGFYDTTRNLIEVCLGDTFSFQVTIWDYVGYREDSLDTLLITSNVQNVLPNSTMSINAINDSVHVVTIGWRAVNTGTASQSFFIQTSDDACPIPGFTTSSYTVKVIPATEAGPPKYICRDRDTARVNVIGGSAVTWRVLYGDPLSYGNNWECDTTARDTCMKARFWPQNTTLYEVSSNLGQGCKTKDTIKVVVADDFSTPISLDTTICFNDSTIQIDVNPSLTGRSFTYKWAPSTKVDNDTIKNPNVTPIFSTQFNVTVTSDSGCIRDTFMNVTVTPPFPTVITPVADDTVACAGSPIGLEAQLGHVPTSCGVSTYACSGTELDITFGTGALANSATGTGPAAWPAPYGGSYNSAKHQFLFRRSELAAQGIDKGMITAIALDVSSVNGSANYNSFTIKLGCTNDTVLSQWQTGLGQVFNPKTITVASGWNKHTFDANYDYDGQSNIVVEICFNNNTNSQSSATRYTATTFNSCLSQYSNAGNACQSNSVSWGSTSNRPNMKLTYCPGPDTNAYTYQWIPSTYLNNDTLNSPTATIYDTISYQVVVNDTFGKCFDTSSIVTIKLTDVEVAQNDTAVCPGVPVQLGASGSSRCPGGGYYAWTPGNVFNDDSIANPIATVYNDTKIEVNFYDTCGCSTTDTMWIRMKSFDPPNIVRTDPTCGFDNGVYQISGSGGVAPYTYSIDSGNNYQNSGVFNNLANGFYEIVIKDAEGCYSSKFDTLKNSAPLIDSIKLTDLECFEAADGEIEVFASAGFAPYTYSVDSGQSFVSNSRISGLSAGDYYVIVQSADGCFTRPIKVTLSQPSELLSGLRKTEVSCFGLCDARTIATPRGGVPPYSFNWGNGAAADTAYNVCGGLDSLIVTDANGCVFDSVFTVVEFPEVKIDSLDLTDVNCFGFGDGEVGINASGGKTALYYSIDGGLSFSLNKDFNGLLQGNYQVMIRDINNCRDSQNIVISEPPRLQLNTSVDSATICISNCQTITASATGGNAGPKTFHWGPNLGTGSSIDICPVENGVYTIYAEDQNGCVTPVKRIPINLFDSLKAVVSEDVAVCKGEAVRLNAVASGGKGNGYRFKWSPISGLGAENSATPLARPFYPTMYYLELTDDCGTPAYIDSVFVDVLNLPPVDFTTETQIICQPGVINFRNITPGSEQCYWDFGNGLQIQTCEEVGNKYTRPGFYDVKLVVTDVNGCTDSTVYEDYIQVLKRPLAAFNMLPNPVDVQNTKMEFKDRSTKDVVKWNWFFESLGNSEEQNPSFTWPDVDTGSYPVRLLVEAENGCIDDTVMTAMVGMKYSFYIPNSFTPNGDGMNEVFLPKGFGVEDDQFRMVIYDRWGKIIFESTDQNVGWDGTIPENGQPAPVGTYAWRIFVGDYEAEKGSYEYIGELTLIR